MKHGYTHMTQRLNANQANGLSGINPDRPKKSRRTKSKIKTLLVTFFDYKGMIHHEFLEEGRTINQYVYLDILRRLREAIRLKRPELWEKKEWILLHDNACPHKALSVRQYFAKHGTAELPHPPYSPDLSPPDYFLFPKMKSFMKGTKFDDLNAIKEKSKVIFRSIPRTKFAK